MKFFEQIRHFLNEQSDFKALFEDVAKQYGIPRFILKLDSIYCRFRYGSPTAQYIGFQFYRMNRYGRNQYMTDHRIKKVTKILNNAPKEEKDILNKKHLFNRTFNEYIERKWIYVPEASEEDIYQFLKNNTEVIGKPDDKKKGEGIRKIHCAEVLNNFSVFLEQARREKLLMEQLIEQHTVLNCVNPTSVNTIRVCTVKDKNGNVNIFAASLRAGGADSIVDNLHAGGAQYPIDPKTGIIIRGGVQFDGKQDICFHPSTNMKMIGLEVPNWNIVLNTVNGVAQKLNNIRYVGWDVAVTEDGCELIEANLSQGCNGMQQDGAGKYKLIKQYY